MILFLNWVQSLKLCALIRKILILFKVSLHTGSPCYRDVGGDKHNKPKIWLKIDCHGGELCALESVETRNFNLCDWYFTYFDVNCNLNTWFEPRINLKLAKRLNTEVWLCLPLLVWTYRKIVFNFSLFSYCLIIPIRKP